MKKPEENLDEPAGVPEDQLIGGSFRLGHWRVDAAAGELIDGERRRRLEPKLMRILQVLATEPGQVVSRSRLFEIIWPQQVIADQTLDSAISRLRAQLDDNPRSPMFIKTVPKVGYRLLAPVIPIEAVAPEHTDFDLERVELESNQANLRSDRGASKLTWSAGLFLLLTIGIIAWVWTQRPTPSLALIPQVSPAPDAPSLALLPWTGTDEFNTDDSLGSPESQGLYMDLSDQLGRLPGLRVASRNSSSRFSSALIEHPIEAQRVAQRLGVDYLLGGRWTSNDQELKLLLIESERGQVVWEQVHHQPGSSGLAIRDALLAQVIETLLPSGAGLSAQSDIDRPVASTTYDLYLLGRHYWNQRQADTLLEAERLFREAATAEPLFALAHIGLASTYLSMMRYSGLAADEALELAQAPMARAMELAPSLAETHELLGQWHWLKAEWVPAEASLKRALSLNPNLVMAQMYLGNVYNDTGRLGQAYASYQQASVLDPLHTTVLMNLTQVSLKLGLYDRSHRYLERAKALFPSHDFLFGLSMHLAISADDRERASALLSDWQADQIVRRDSSDPVDVLACIMGAAFLDDDASARACVGMLPEARAKKEMQTLYALMAASYTVWVESQDGDPPSASSLRALQAYFDAFEVSDPEDPVLLYELAAAQAVVGQVDKSISMFLRSSEFGGRDLGWMQSDPRLEAIRDRAEVVARLAELRERQRMMVQVVLEDA